MAADKINQTAFSINRKLLPAFVIVMVFLASTGLANICLGGHIYWFTGLFMGISLYLLSLLLIYLFFRKSGSRLSRWFVLTSTTFLLILFTEAMLRIIMPATSGESNRGFFVSPYFIRIGKQYLHLPPSNSEKKIHSCEFNYVFHTNSLGLSDKEHPQYKAEDTVIIGLGDSFTEGVGAPADSGWLKLTEKYMAGSGERGLHFINAGVGGSDPVYEYRLLKERLLDYHPDLVVVTLAYDIEDLICRGGYSRLDSTSPVRQKPEKWWIPLYGMSYIFRSFIHQFTSFNHLFLNPEEYSKARKEAVGDMILCCNLYKSLAFEKGFRLLFVFCPLKHEVKNGRFDDWEPVMNHLQKIEIPYVDMLAHFTASGMNAENLHEYYWSIDEHLNSRGYYLFAEGMIPAIDHELKKQTAYERPETSPRTR